MGPVLASYKVCAGWLHVIEQYLVPAVYPSALSHSVQLGLAGLVVVVNTFVYLLVLRKHTNVRKKPAD